MGNMIRGIACLLLNPALREFRKSVNIWRSLLRYGYSYKASSALPG